MSAEEIKTWLGILGVVCGAAIALIKFFFAQKEKIDNLEKKSVVDLITQTQVQIRELHTMFKEVSEKFSTEIENLKKETADLRIIQTQHVTEMKTFGKAMLEVHRHFAGDKPAPASSERITIGKDAWIIREKKKAEGDE